ncbi:hypothetical protein [Stenotrophomonas sp.]|uniref:hypothetical protein n=1 Tax=Stenotrophomonas sp. TaxID=69392 RepID=UPI0028AC187E|nr:hypothetical protein [Stenotrophomonas sp.]
MQVGFPARIFAVPDYARFTNHRLCEAAIQRRELIQLQLLPSELGGGNEASNLVFVPPTTAEQKRRIDQHSILPLFSAGKLQHYNAQPVFRGSSLVPVEITLHAHDPAGFSTTLCIW